MLNLKVLENLRTKDEILDFFKDKNVKITNEEIEDFKNNYQQNKVLNNCLSLKQLNKVSGGEFIIHVSQMLTEGASHLRIINPLLGNLPAEIHEQQYHIYGTSNKNTNEGQVRYECNGAYFENFEAFLHSQYQEQANQVFLLFVTCGGRPRIEGEQSSNRDTIAEQRLQDGTEWGNMPIL